jgi:hypothetical protein
MARLMVLLVMAVGLCLAGGCATENDSDMPWNTPQPWEGAPGIPGFTPAGR